jgi:hypothetical protein
VVAAETLADRVSFGRRYVELLAQPGWSNWLKGYERFCAGHLDTVEVFSLLHPDWRASWPLESLQGPRRFALADAGIGGLKPCQANVIWGYDCTRQSDDPTQVDHMFPYAFGGATVAGNRLELCRVHNSVKAHDIHLYPWEKGVPSWVTPLLKRIHTRLTA